MNKMAAAAIRCNNIRLSLLICRRFSNVSQQETKFSEVEVQGKHYVKDDMTNVTPHILSKIGKNLLHTKHHPLNVIKQRICTYFQSRYTTRTGTPLYTAIDDVSPVVTTEQNFTSLLCPEGHPARSRSDNYYINSNYMLRAHTSAHQRDFIKMGFDKFLVAGDVYRRDEIDSTHYPVFHQMEGVSLFRADELDNERTIDLFLENIPPGGEDLEGRQAVHSLQAVEEVSANLKVTLDGLVRHLFGEDTETRWLPCYFPFTHPSFELEIKFKGEWLEVLGSGVMKQQILNSAGVQDKIGWAFGLGLDRLAMLLFQIPDIRLLWSQDPRFLGQFQHVGLDPDTNITFLPYSKFPPCYKDISFWLKEDTFIENDFYELIRSIGGDLVERVERIDSFIHPQTQRRSLCYRVMYRSMERSLTNEEVNVLQDQIRDSVKSLCVELR